jgi:hypothetical protein
VFLYLSELKYYVIFRFTLINMEAFNILGKKLFRLHSKKRYFVDHRPIMFKPCYSNKKPCYSKKKLCCSNKKLCRSNKKLRYSKKKLCRSNKKLAVTGNCVTVKRNHEFAERMCRIFIAKLLLKEEPKSFIIKAPVNAERSGMDERCNGGKGG